MATSGSFYSSLKIWDGDTYKLYTDWRFEWEIVSQDLDNLTSTIAWRVVTRQTFDAARTNPAGPGYKRGVRAGSSITINGAKFSTSSSVDVNNGYVVQSSQLVIPHNADGTKDFTATFAYKIGSDSVNCTGSHTFTLDPIPLNPLIYIKNSSSWKKGHCYVKSGGNWYKAKKIYYKTGGSWIETPLRG